MTFINLHVHDEYSQLDGFGKAEDYAERAKILNQLALASTNHGNIDGLIKHQRLAKRKALNQYWVVNCMSFQILLSK